MVIRKNGAKDGSRKNGVAGKCSPKNTAVGKTVEEMTSRLSGFQTRNIAYIGTNLVVFFF